MESNLVLQGNIDVRQVNLAFKVDGRIKTLDVDEGDTVKAGQVLATLDKRYFNDDLRLARAGATTLPPTWNGWSTVPGRRRLPRPGPLSRNARSPSTSRSASIRAWNAW